MNIGLDNGRGNVKVVCGNRRKIFESYCGRGYEMDFSYGKENYEVQIDNEKYFVGALAKREGMSRCFQKHKIDNKRTKPLVLTAISLMTIQDSNVNIVTGTPISDYREQKDQIEMYLRGKYKVKVTEEEQKEIEIENVKVFPEGAGAYFSKILNMNGEVCDKELATTKVGIVDIGYKTTNISVFDNLKFVDKLSATFNFGIHQAFNMIYKRLSREEDITPEQVENITTGYEFKTLSDRIQTEINKFWGNISFKIFICGGGAYLLKDYFPKFELINKPEFANAEGYYKIAQMLYKPKVERWTFGQ
ncbi:ParM/StbA family protein [Crassaminicella thermophila]|uniref:ParM/StbA family protein n=1 Tax=Crassaminicella thermophila TaxID=2599308 RepID=A0A5C0SHY3_CRATE|nr:ParM/StbA family protein [Crassaminicella thermophila]QEK12559.1 ParM/StbA family protein [Crassaminicella thermophila]